MKTTFSPVCKKTPTFPAFRMWENGNDAFNGGIVMFTDEDTAIVLHVETPNSTRKVGEFLFLNSVAKLDSSSWKPVSGNLVIELP